MINHLDKPHTSKVGSMQLNHGKSSTDSSAPPLDLLTGDDLNDDKNGDGWGEDDDFEDWGSLEEGKGMKYLYTEY